MQLLSPTDTQQMHLNLKKKFCAHLLNVVYVTYHFYLKPTSYLNSCNCKSNIINSWIAAMCETTFILTVRIIQGFLNDLEKNLRLFLRPLALIIATACITIRTNFLQQNKDKEHCESALSPVYFRSNNI